MSSRNLELTVRAKADTRDLEKLSRELGTLVTDLRKSDAAFDATGDSAKKMVGTISQLTAEEMKHIQAASRTVTALEQAATARERSNRAAADALGAEQRMSTAQEQSAQAAIRTAAAQERLRQAQSNTVAVAARTASAEERLAQEREKTLQATSKTEKAELDVARAREQLRAATVRAEQAEKKAAETKRSYGLATDMVRKQIAAFVSGAALVQAGRMMLNFGRDAVNAASDVEEGAAKFQQVFGNLSDGVEKDLQRMADANRRSLYDLKDFASELQNTFVPLGFAREQASAFAQTITQLGIDIAAFSNKADADVIHNLTSAIVGNHEAVRSYGIVLTQTVINQELAANGWDKLTGAALETAKAQARLNIIMRASADAQGAAVREADSYANTLKAWDAAVLDLKVSVGEGLLPAMTGLTEAAIWLTNVMQAGKMFRIPHEEALASAKTVEDIVKVIRQAQADLSELDFWEKLIQDQKGTSLQLAEDQIRALADATGNYADFLKIVTAEYDKMTLKAARFDELKPSEWKGAVFVDAEENMKGIYDYLQALEEMQEMEAAYQAQLEKRRIAAGSAEDGMRAWNEVIPKQKPDSDFTGAWESATSALKRYGEALVAAKSAQKEFNLAYGEALNAAPVDDLVKAREELAALQGQTDYDFGSDAAVAARDAIVSANQDIAQSHRDRAYASMEAQLIEEGRFDELANWAVTLGIMSAEEAKLRQQYAETAAVQAELLKSTDFLTLSMGGQEAALKGVIAGLYDTAAAAVAAQKAYEATRNFFNTAPDSYQIGQYYQNLADGVSTATAGADAGVTTTVSVQIDQTTKGDFQAFRADLEKYDSAKYITSIAAEGVDTTQDGFESMRTMLGDLTAEAWVIKVKYETEGTPPTGGGGGGGGPTTPRSVDKSGAYVDLVVNNYGGGPSVEGAVRNGVMAAFRSMG